MDNSIRMKIRFRRDLSSLWQSRNPILLSGEPGLETDTNKLKLGDGVRSWNNLPYIYGDVGEQTDIENSFVDIRNFNAIGDGITDDTEAIENALEFINGKGRILIEDGTYLIRRPIVLSSNQSIIGNGTIKKVAAVRKLITTNAAAGQTFIYVDSVDGLNIGDCVTASDISSREWLSTRAIISDISESGPYKIMLDTPLRGTLQTTRTAMIIKSFPIITNKNSDDKNIVVSGVTLDHNYIEGEDLSYTIDGNAAINFTNSAIHWVGARQSTVKNVTILNSVADGYSDQAQDGLGLFPAENLIKISDNTIKDCKIISAQRHGTHLGTCIQGGMVISNIILNCGNMGHFFCAYATRAIYANNIIRDCAQGLALGDDRDFGNIIIGNTIENTTFWGIEAGKESVIIGNTIRNSIAGIKLFPGAKNSIINDNWVEVYGTYEALRISSGCDQTIISGNYFKGGSSGSYIAAITGSEKITFNNNVCTDCYRGVSLNSVTYFKALNNRIDNLTVGYSWMFSGINSDVDVDINNKNAGLFSGALPIRLSINGVGNNGAVNPKFSGEWYVPNQADIDKSYLSGKRVTWNDGTQHISEFIYLVGWVDLTSSGGFDYNIFKNSIFSGPGITILKDDVDEKVTISASAPVLNALPLVSNNKYTLGGTVTNTTSLALSPAGKMVAHPIWLPAGNYKELSVDITAAGTSIYRFGIYPNNPNTYTPDGEALLQDLGVMDMSIIPGLLNISLTIPESNVWWIAILCASYLSSPNIFGWDGNPARTPVLPYTGYLASNSSPGRGGWARSMAGVPTQSMPSVHPSATSVDVGIPRVSLKAN